MSSVTFRKYPDFGLLLLRLIFGGAMLSHGLPKLMAFSNISQGFPDPLGVGSPVSLSLTIFAEVICALGLMLGVFGRASAMILFFTMAVAFLVVHGADPFAQKELAFLYGFAYLGLALTGPGRWALKK